MNKKNKIIRRLLSILLCAVLIFSLSACGVLEKVKGGINIGGKDKSSAHIKLGKIELDYLGAEIMKDTDGKDALVISLSFTNNGKEDASYIWSVSEEAVQGKEALSTTMVVLNPFTYETTTDSQLLTAKPGETLDIRTAFLLEDRETPVKITFSQLLGKKSGKITVNPAELASSEPQNTFNQSTGDSLLDWWNGEWYGWWIMRGCSGAYEKYEGLWWDCYAYIDAGSDYNGTITIWDDTCTKDDGLSVVSISLSASGTGSHGTLFSEDGYFLGADVAHADWIVDPGLMDYDNMINIDGWYEGEDGEYHYILYLRPWGVLWDDVAANGEDMSLPYYYDIYKSYIEAGLPLPENVRELAGETD